jgi:low affinity Fe/Cu permease
MNGQYRYLTATTKKLSENCEKPLTVVTLMAFLFAWMVIMPFAGLSVMANLVISVALVSLNFALVILLQNAHHRDIHALKARLAELAASQPVDEAEGSSKPLNTAELLQIRDYLARHQDDHAEPDRRANRDMRPSLF